MNIAILGGSFDPPHIWHFWTARQILEKVKGLDQVWYLPDFTNAFKPTVASFSNRVEMLRTMETGRLRVSTIASAREGITYTVEIVQELLKDKDNKYYWIIGSDVMREVIRWRDYLKLSRLIPFLVFPRKDYPIGSLPSGFTRVEGQMMMSNVSSSLIRERLKKNLLISGLVFPGVEEYIKKKGLYK